MTGIMFGDILSAAIGSCNVTWCAMVVAGQTAVEMLSAYIRYWNKIKVVPDLVFFEYC